MKTNNPFARVARINTPPTFYRCEHGWQWVPPPLADHDLWYVLSGLGTMRLRGNTVELRAGVCFVLRPGTEPCGSQDPERRLTVFAVHFDFAGPAVPVPVSATVRDTYFFNALAGRCEAAFRRRDPLGREQSRLCLEQMLLLLCEEQVVPPPMPVDTRIQKIIAEIQTEPGRRWAIDVLAKKVHLSRSQFTRRFTAATGDSPTRFLVRARLDRARRLMEETDMTLSQIAAALDYQDIYFFSRQFKQFMGKPPSAMRQSNAH